jgi:soluble cytochrome b562
MADQKQDVNQAHHELERQRYRLQKELAGFQTLAEQLKDVEQRAKQGDAVAVRQVQQLEAVANGEFRQQMNALLAQLDDLQKKYERLSRMQKSSKRPANGVNEYKNEGQGKFKKKRRTRIKYL